MTDRYFKLSEIQEMFGISRTTVWRWHSERGLKIVTIGNVTRIRENDLQAFLRRHETETISEKTSVDYHKPLVVLSQDE